MKTKHHRKGGGRGGHAGISDADGTVVGDVLIQGHLDRAGARQRAGDSVGESTVVDQRHTAVHRKQTVEGGGGVDRQGLGACGGNASGAVDRQAVDGEIGIQIGIDLIGRTRGGEGDVIGSGWRRRGGGAGGVAGPVRAAPGVIRLSEPVGGGQSSTSDDQPGRKSAEVSERLHIRTIESDITPQPKADGVGGTDGGCQTLRDSIKSSDSSVSPSSRSGLHIPRGG